MRLQSFVTSHLHCKMYKTTSSWFVFHWFQVSFVQVKSEHSVPFNTGVGQANVVVRCFLWIKALIFH